eukprot:TRINITY_DN4764_c0_g1_i1.p1 TRINITY_DN4764_c0_g1~~TRINITY_DN4764_c0_g1_i1.p1  ORF type:complete len:637 (+),score=102.36 TRINITY_DN4764_c0_g1_i1:1248-3158(+)
MDSNGPRSARGHWERANTNVAPESDAFPRSRSVGSPVFSSSSIHRPGAQASHHPNAPLDVEHPPQASTSMDAVPAPLFPSVGDAPTLPPQRGSMVLDDFPGSQAAAQLNSSATWWRPAPSYHNGGGAAAPGSGLAYSPGAGVESPFWPVPPPGNIMPSPGVIEVVAAAEAASGSTATTRAAPASGNAPPPGIHLQPMEGSAGEPWSSGGGGGVGGREVHPAVGASFGLPPGLPTSSAPWASMQPAGGPWSFGTPVTNGDLAMLAAATMSNASMLPAGRPRPASVPPSWLTAGGDHVPGGTPFAAEPAVNGGSSVPNASPVPPLQDMLESQPLLAFDRDDMATGSTDDRNGTADIAPVPTTAPNAVPGLLSTVGNTPAQQPRSFFLPDPAVTSSSDSVAQSGSPPTDGSQGDTDWQWPSPAAALDGMVAPAGPAPASWPPAFAAPQTAGSGWLEAGPVPHDALGNVAFSMHAQQHPLPNSGGAAAMARVAAEVDAANAAATEQWQTVNAERLRACDSPTEASRLSNLRAAFVSRAGRRAKKVALKREVALAAGAPVLAAVDSAARAAGVARRNEWAVAHQGVVHEAKAEVQLATAAAAIASPLGGGHRRWRQRRKSASTRPARRCASWPETAKAHRG